MSLDQKRQMLVDIRIKKSLLEAKIEGSKHESPIKKSILPIPTITRIPQHARRSNLPLPNYSTPNSPALTRFKQLSPPRSIKSHIFKQPSMLTSKSAPFQVIQEDRRLIALTLNNTRLNKDRKCQIVYQVIRKQGSRPDSPIKPKRSIDYNSFDDIPVQGCNLKWNTVVDCREYEVLEAFNENEEKHIINIDTTLEPLVKRQRISSLDERFNSIFRGKRILKGCLKKEPQSFRLEFGEVELKRVIVPVRRVVYSDDPVHH